MLNYYKSKDIDLNRVCMIAKERYHIKTYLTMEAAQLLYNKIRDGLEVKPVSVIWIILAGAKTLKRVESDIGLDSINGRMNTIETMLVQINDRTENTFLKRTKNNLSRLFSRENYEDQTH